ncbi:pseudoazurin [Mameliella alba]|uniref:Pseudoazurin n=1 Tax=Mameliella alba TaxID=561184 RepID=A0A0B3S2L5_9RHOB|nr:MULTISPECIES: pseudoazurin [Mameliella]MBV6634355.1 pseudoazurin [Mameliella sp.]MCR9273566.1 pseudoazurin [Paracoccaceae bacterium]KHQ50916.1 Pseudoazurin [Mameliella alba]OWV44714.1 pseudoazurin [Mameliella alba]OWV55035.1 pseudoazurin [Mameliella alba]
MLKTLTLAASLALTAGLAHASDGAVHEIQMLNKGADGAMVFEPAFVQADPGDVIRFVPTDKGHNVEAIDGMLPEGVKGFKSKFNKPFDLSVEAEGVYGVKCTPHYAMGMVALIQVGDAVNLDAAQAVKQRGQAAKRFGPLFEQVQ